MHIGSGSTSGFLGGLRPLFKLSFKTIRQFEELLKAPLTTFFFNFYCYCLELALIFLGYFILRHASFMCTSGLALLALIHLTDIYKKGMNC